MERVTKTSAILGLIALAMMIYESWPGRWGDVGAGLIVCGALAVAYFKN